MKFKTDELRPKVVVGVAAHPDDLEFVMGASAAKWAKAGTKVFYVVCSDGSKGSSSKSGRTKNIASAELIKIRRSEQETAASLLGVEKVFFLDYEDATMEPSIDLKRDISRIIRQLKPDTVVTIDPSFLYSVEHSYINHPDHRAVGMATLDGVYPLARDHLSFPELTKDGLQPHKAASLLLTNFSNLNYYEDVTATFDQKMKALKAHKSQFPEAVKIERFLRTLAEQAGKAAGCQLAEGFIRIDLPD